MRVKTVLQGLVLLATIHSGSAAAESAGLRFADIIGWWAAEPEFAGERSRVLLHFLEEGGKQSVRLSLLAIGGFDVPIGTVTVKDDDALDMEPYLFPLKYDRAADTLSGVLLEGAVPVYKIPVVFRRIPEPEKPADPTWDDHPRPAPIWTYDAGAPVWAGLEYDAAADRLFIGTDAGMLHALNGDGSAAWRFETGGPIRTRPAAIGDALYVASDSGFLVRLDSRTGEARWRARIDSGSPPRIPATQPDSRWDRYGSSVTTDGRRLFVASRDGAVYAIDADTGAQVWRVKAKDMLTATPAVYRDTVLVADFAGQVQALAAADGAPRWQYDARLAVPGDLVVDGDRVFAGSRTYDLIALDARDGRELWKHYYWFSWIESPPVVRDGVVYTGSSDGTSIFAVDAASGARRWKAAVPGYAWARVAVSDELVVAGTVGRGAFPGGRAGSLAAVDRASGAIRWLYIDPPTAEEAGKKMEWGFAASPVIVDDVVYAADLKGRVHAFRLANPATASQVPADSSPAGTQG